MRAVRKFTTGDNPICIAEYKSASEAARELGVKGISNIIKCCNGELEKAYGFSWEFVDQDMNYQVDDMQRVKTLQNEFYTNKKYKHIVPPFIINQYSINHTLMTQWRSVADACNALGLKSSPQVYDCLNGKVGCAHGYIWEYINQNSL